MTEELLETVIKLYKSSVLENLQLADNIVLHNGYAPEQAKILMDAILSSDIEVALNSTMLSEFLDLFPPTEEHYFKSGEDEGRLIKHYYEISG